MQARLELLRQWSRRLDSAFEIRAFKDHIDWMAGAGPEATNTQMPPDDGPDDGPAPTLAEREQLAQWLACDAPE